MTETQNKSQKYYKYYTLHTRSKQRCNVGTFQNEYNVEHAVGKGCCCSLGTHLLCIRFFLLQFVPHVPAPLLQSVHLYLQLLQSINYPLDALLKNRKPTSQTRQGATAHCTAISQVKL